MGSQVKAKARSEGAEEILGAIRRIAREMRVSGRAAEEAAGLSGAQLAVLSRVAEGKGVSIGELAEHTMTDPSSVSVVVGRLAASGLVTRRRSPEDERRVEIAITAAGRAALRKAPTASKGRLAAAIEGLSATKRAALARLLDEVVSGMRGDEEGSTSAKPK